jgi:hypothetical protein
VQPANTPFDGYGIHNDITRKEADLVILQRTVFAG